MPLNAIRTVGARMLLNKYFEDFGEVTDIRIDPRANLAELMVALKGEEAPVRLDVNYRVVPGYFVTVHFRCEREWIANLLNRFLAGRHFEIDSGVAQVLLDILL